MPLHMDAGYKSWLLRKYEYLGFRQYRIYEMFRISSPVTLNLFRKLAVDMHGGTAVLLILLDMCPSFYSIHLIYSLLYNFFL